LSRLLHVLPSAVLAAVLIAACGGSAERTTSSDTSSAVTSEATSSTATSTPSTVTSTPTTLGTSTASELDTRPPSAPKVPGYALSPAPDCTAEMTQVLGKTGGVLSAVSCWNVAPHGTDTDIGALAVFRLATKYATKPAVAQTLLPGLIGGLAGSGATVSQRTIGGVKVGEGSGKQLLVYVWHRNGLINMYFTDPGEKSSGRAFVASYIAVT